MEEILIRKNGELYDVIQGDKGATRLVFEEMLGVIITLASGKDHLDTDRYRSWMRTESEQIEYEKSMKKYFNV